MPDRYLRDPDRVLTVAEWDELQIPVGLVFFLYRSGPGQLSCFYPSPAGATESALDLPAWERLAAAHPLLRQAEPDVEAVLISQQEGPGIEYFIVPIDVCYELAGRMRMHVARFRRRHRGPGRASRNSWPMSAAGPGPPRGIPAMAELVFDCIGARPERYAVVPSFSLTLRISETTGQRVDAIALRCADPDRAIPAAGTPMTRRTGCTTCSASGSAGRTRSSHSSSR